MPHAVERRVVAEGFPQRVAHEPAQRALGVAAALGGGGAAAGGAVEHELGGARRGLRILGVDPGRVVQRVVALVRDDGGDDRALVEKLAVVHVLAVARGEEHRALQRELAQLVAQHGLDPVEGVEQQPVAPAVPLEVDGAAQGRGHLTKARVERLHVAAAIGAAQLASEPRRLPARIPLLAAVRAEGRGQCDAHDVDARFGRVVDTPGVRAELLEVPEVGQVHGHVGEDVRVEIVYLRLAAHSAHEAAGHVRKVEDAVFVQVEARHLGHVEVRPVPRGAFLRAEQARHVVSGRGALRVRGQRGERAALCGLDLVIELFLVAVRI